MRSRPAVLRASDRLEELTIIARDMVNRLRDGSEDDPYAALYWLRTQLGYEVARLGVGVPSGVRHVGDRYHDTRRQIEES